MKKKVVFTILGIILFIAIVIGIVFTFLNKEKSPITAKQFKTTMEEQSYIVADATEQFSQYDYIKQVYVAAPSDYIYKIEFYELADDSYAMGFYNNNKSIFESSKGNSSKETNVNMKNHSKYTLSSNGKYQVVSRIDNTVIYLNIDDSYKDDAKSLLKELGY